MENLLDYLEEKTGIKKDELLSSSKVCNPNWAEKFIKKHSKHLVGQRVHGFDDIDFYVVKLLSVCDNGYVCINRQDGTRMRLSAALNGDYIN